MSEEMHLLYAAFLMLGPLLGFPVGSWMARKDATRGGN